MARHVLTIRSLGEQTCWLLLQQSIGITDAKAVSDFMTEKVALLFFAETSLAERMCVSAAVRQMGGSTIYQGERDTWHDEVHEYQEHLMSIFDYYVDCLYTYGLPVKNWDEAVKNAQFPVVNAGSPEAHPAHALADIACMLRAAHKLDGVVAGWIGCNNGTLHSLIEATAWFPFSLKIALPPFVNRTPLLEDAKRLGTSITFVDTPEEAAENVDFILAGCLGGVDPNDILQWKIDEHIMAKAKDNVHLMLSSSPGEAIRVDKNVLSSKTSLLVKQSEFRLRVHKRILHWIFSGE